MEETYTHKCPNCGGPLVFDPSSQKFTCDYCGSTFSEQDIADFEAGAKVEDIGELDLFSCPNCGAEIVTDATTAATYCYYCHNPVVLTKRLSGEFQPDLVLPFTIEKEEAKRKFIDWASHKRYIPKDFFNEEQIEKMTGVYFPYWNVTGEVAGDYSAEGKRVRVWRTGDTEYTETKIYNIQRDGSAIFHELVKNALNKNVSDKMVASVQPFPIEKCIPFKSQYLAGFQAEKRDVEFSAIADNVNQELKQYTKQLLRDTAHGYTAVSRENFSGSVTNTQTQYILLPIWLVTYRAENDSDKIYYYAMNGQTGKTSGILPLNRSKLALHAAGVAALFTILGLLGGLFL